MKFSIKFAVIIFIFSCLCGCSSTHTKLRNVRLGTFKRQALSKFGEPTEKYRTKGRDHWVYETQKKSKKGNQLIIYKHTIVFEEGVLVDKNFTRSFTSKELEDFQKDQKNQ